MKYKNIFWGVLFICFGGLFLLRNMDLIDFDWVNILYLWPLLFVLWGVSLLPIKGWIRLILSFLAIVLGFALMDKYEKDHHRNFKFNFKHDKESAWEDNHRDYPLDQEFSEPFDTNTKEVKFKLDAVVGEYKIYGGSENLIDFKRSGNVGKYSLITRDLENDRKEVKISMKDGETYHLNNKNKVNIDLNDQIIWDCDFDFGAADIYADLSENKVKRLKLDGGASNAEFKLGMQYADVVVDIDAGVSNFTLRIPKEAGCKINSDGFMANKDLEGFVKTSRGNFRTKNYKESEVKINVKMDVALSNLEVIRY